MTVTERTPEGFNGNKSWDVTFTSLQFAGDIPLMRFDPVDRVVRAPT